MPHKKAMVAHYLHRQHSLEEVYVYCCNNAIFNNSNSLLRFCHIICGSIVIVMKDLLVPPLYEGCLLVDII